MCLFFLFSGHHNCPSGFDESEEECGTARKLLELPGGVFAALGCIAAAVTACLIFCIFGLLRKRKKTVLQKSIINGGSTLKKDFKKESLFIDPASWHGLQPVEYIHVDRETTVWYVVKSWLPRWRVILLKLSTHKLIKDMKIFLPNKLLAQQFYTTHSDRWGHSSGACAWCTIYINDVCTK